MNGTRRMRLPRPSMRSARPNAAVDLPLPAPVCTMRRPFAIFFAAASASCTALRFAIFARWRAVSASLMGLVMASLSWASLHDERHSGDEEDHAVCARGETLVELALEVAEAPGQRVVGHDAGTDFVGDEHDRAGATIESRLEPPDLPIHIAVCPHAIS